MKWWIFLLVVAGPAVAQDVRRALPVAPEVAPAEVAKFLAGVPLPEGTALAPLQAAPEYRAHVRELAKLTQHYDRNFFARMREWAAAELSTRLPGRQNVFYFFGGPDAVSALALFPDAPVYLLGGLEPVGTVASPGRLPPEELWAALANLRKSLEVILSYGHFITKDMKAELDRTAFRGVLPLLYVFVCLTGGDVLAAEPMKVLADGSVGPAGAPGGLPAVRVRFRSGPGNPEQVIFYVQANVADDALKSGNGVLAWAKTYGPGVVYLKAASYLLHEAYFSRVRAFLLGNAVAVVQDDSGIPFRFFLDGNWQIALFGTYSGTLEIFREYRQGDLQEAFGAGTARPLPFGTGYKWRVGESNVLVAVRTQIPRAEPVR
jgi:hypothetical protein